MHAPFLTLLSLVWHVLNLIAARKRIVPKENWSQDCRSCQECSKENGCLSCPQRLFLYLHRDGVSHHGTCLHSCPTGHYGMRRPEANHCIKCKAPECERCFDTDFCTKCKGGFLLFKGKCFSSCPKGTYAHFTDCIDNCAYSALSIWGEWSPCLNNDLNCSIGWGHQNRTRELSRRMPENHTALCPPLSQRRRCLLKKRCTQEKTLQKRKLKRIERRRRRKQMRIMVNSTVA